MYPDGNYKLGQEARVGTEGNGPVLLYTQLPLLIAVSSSMIFTYGNFAPSDGPWIEYSLSGVLFWFAISFSIALSTQIIFQLILRHRFRRLYTNTKLEYILNKVRLRMGFTKPVEVWLLSSDKQVLIPLNGLISRALIISTLAEENLLASPEYAEVILADNLRDIETPPVLSTWLPVFSFVVISSLLLHLTGMILHFVFGFIFITYLFFGSSIGIWSAGCGRKIRVNSVIKEYDIHPDIARYQVFRNSPPTNQEIELAFEKYGAPNWRSNDDIKGLISYFAAISFSLVLIIMFWNPVFPQITEPFEFSNIILGISTSIATLICFLVIFFVIMKVVYRKDESILG